jgi:hypothetical protein
MKTSALVCVLALFNGICFGDNSMLRPPQSAPDLKTVASEIRFPTKQKTLTLDGKMYALLSTQPMGAGRVYCYGFVYAKVGPEWHFVAKAKIDIVTDLRLASGEQCLLIEGLGAGREGQWEEVLCLSTRLGN